MRRAEFLLLAAGALCAPSVSAQERRTLQECLRLATEHHPQLAEAAAAREEARAERFGALGRYGPVLRVEANVGRWNAPLDVALPLDIPGLSVPPLHARDRNTAQLSATLVQPLGSLWTIHEAHQAQALALHAAEAQAVVTRHDVAFAVLQAYLQALEAEAAQAITTTLVQQVEAHLARARRLQAQSMLGHNEVLQAELGLSEARSGLAQATAGAAQARANLAFRVGLSPRDGVWPAALDETALPPALLVASDGPRPELVVAHDRLEQSRVATRLAWSRLLPELNAVVTRQHLEGLPLIPPDSLYVGGQLAWNLWEGGATYWGIKAAQARVTRASEGARLACEGLQLEAVAATLALTAAEAQLPLSAQAVEQATENLRTVELRFANQAAASVDVVDAAVLLAKARNREVTARQGLLLAKARATRAGTPADCEGE